MTRYLDILSRLESIKYNKFSFLYIENNMPKNVKEYISNTNIQLIFEGNDLKAARQYLSTLELDTYSDEIDCAICLAAEKIISEKFNDANLFAVSELIIKDN